MNINYLFFKNIFLRSRLRIEKIAALLKKNIRIKKCQKTQLLIYGVHSEDWMTALAPTALVWKKISAIKAVQHIDNRVSDQLMKQLLQKKNCTVILPLMESHIENCPRQFHHLIPSLPALKIIGNKKLFAVYVREQGLSHLCPITYSSIDEVKFPCIVKRSDLNAGQGIICIHTDDQLNRLLAHDDWIGKSFVIQSPVYGSVEYVTHCICKNGTILEHCTFRYDMGSALEMRTPNNVDKITLCEISENILCQLEKLLRSLAYDGPCNIDYKILDNEKIMILEINPRLGGSLMRLDKIDYLVRQLSCLINNASLAGS